MDGAWRRPTDSSLCSGTPSLCEVPSGGARALCLLLSGPAFRLFESEPLSERNPKRPLPQQRICTQSNCVDCKAAFASKPAHTVWIPGRQMDRRRLGGRHRRQASSHIWIAGHSSIGVGCQVHSYLTHALRAVNNTAAAADNKPAQQRLNRRLPLGSANQRRICRPI